jgi:hypothetical protein
MTQLEQRSEVHLMTRPKKEGLFRDKEQTSCVYVEIIV